MQFQLRAPCSGDEAALAELAGQLGYPALPEQIARRLAALGDSQADFVLVAADGAGRPIGWVHAFMALRLESDAFGELGGMVVAEGCQSITTSTSSNSPARIIHNLPKNFSSAGVP